MRLRLPWIDAIIVVPSAVFAALGAWVGYWPGFAFFGSCAVLIVLARWYADRPQPSERVEFDSIRIVRTMPTGQTESIDWIDVAVISILTSDGGPAVEDCYWAFSTADRKRGCLVANGADGAGALLEHILELPHFDQRQFAEAMGSTSNAEFIVWQRDAPPS